ncbi:hypothetical protein CRUP_017707 [Coryphaenoides rupestris]|nr:hypothetical protein CRUP_017707 [Coryphaenoides rupestris]
MGQHGSKTSLDRRLILIHHLGPMDAPWVSLYEHTKDVQGRENTTYRPSWQHRPCIRRSNPGGLVYVVDNPTGGVWVKPKDRRSNPGGLVYVVDNPTGGVWVKPKDRLTSVDGRSWDSEFLNRRSAFSSWAWTTRGKTTLLYKLKHNACVTTVPTVAFNVEMLEAKRGRRNITLTVWDVGGQRCMRQHWPSFLQDAAAVVFVVDSADRPGRLADARRELERTLRGEHLPPRLPVVLLANKQDAAGALSVTELTELFNLPRMCADRDWFIQPCSAATGSGLAEGFDRVAQMLKPPSDPETMKENIKDTVHYIRAKSTRHR